MIRLDLAWTLSDTFNGLMMLPNLIGVVALSGTVVKITQNHLARKLHGSAARRCCRRVRQFKIVSPAPCPKAGFVLC